MHTVVFFHPHFSDGGVERTNIGLAKILIANGLRVIFATTNPTQHFLAELESAGIELQVLDAPSTMRAQIPLLRLIRELKRKGTRVLVISCQYYVNVWCVAFRPLWGRGVRHILSERNHIDEFKIRRTLKHALVPLLVRVLYPFADVIVANSEELGRDLGTMLKRPVAVVLNPTKNERLLKLSQEPITEDWFNSTPAGCRTIIGLGRLAPQKDFSTLVHAFALLSRTHNAQTRHLWRRAGAAGA